MLERLRGNHQLAIIALFGGCAVAGILPFAVYRFATGSILIGTIDAAIVAGLAGVVGYAWRTGATRWPGLVMCVLNSVGVYLSATLGGYSGLFWVYAVLMANFFLMPRPLAAGAAVLLLGALALQGRAFDSTPHLLSFTASAALASALSYILAHWTERQRAELERLATVDSLTGVGNRRAMQDELEIAVAASRRTGIPVGLALVDIDHFKRVNDRHGHQAGDAVLAEFADVLRRSVRRADRVFRFGGEEFLVLVPGTTAKALATVAEQLRATVEARISSPGGPVTASIGAAVLVRGETVEAWLSRADSALYRAKAAGRNRAYVQEPEAAEGGAARVASTVVSD
ncbi:GGDEF domain-containing protein [Lysobacter sp. A3-1-A15]|uniref:GGDEF domain-containing protein n=1 Tax=Novilysobacter viscosus TaxID=3098602 RepID=UPI002ED78930